MAALVHASVDGVALDSDSVVNDLLERWENVRIVFDAVMEHNGIDPNAASELSADWLVAGKNMALAFTASVEQMIGPAVKILDQSKGT